MSTTVIDPGGQGYRIERLYAALVEHGPGDEGIMAVMGHDRVWYVCVASKIESVRKLCELMPHHMRTKSCRIVSFEARVEVERLW